ncbi:MAG: hypothetical protein AB1445_09615 [Bacillota bacterium]
MSIWERFDRIDARWIYLFMALALILPVLRPIGMPMSVNPQLTQPFYDWIEKELPPNSLVIMDAAYSGGSAAECDPQMAANFRHLMKKGHKVVLIAQWELGARLSKNVVDAVAREVGAVYGRDYVVAGWRAGGTPWMRSLQDDFWAGMTGVDIDGTSLGEFPLMQRLKAIKPDQVAGIIIYSAGSPGISTYTQFFPEFPLYVGNVAVQVPGNMPLLQARQVLGMLSGLRGAAEYEKLIGEPGRATKLMDAQSVAHMLIIILIVLGNIGYIVKNRQKSA